MFPQKDLVKIVRFASEIYHRYLSAKTHGKGIKEEVTFSMDILIEFTNRYYENVSWNPLNWHDH